MMIVLILLSYAAFAWMSPLTAVVITVSVLVNFAFAKYIRERRGGRLLLGLALAANLIPLCVNKYTTLLPALGVSYFTFVQIAFLVDSYRDGGAIKFLDYWLSIVFVPKLLAGPIVRPHRFAADWRRRCNSRFHWSRLYLGLAVFMIGFGKKVLLADQVGVLVNAGWQLQTVGAVDAWLTTIGYTLQLYFDFSGYSDMAYGAAIAFNVRLPWNFLSPYKSKSIQEFWRRWHISLSLWLRDYLYFTFGGSRCGLARTVLNVFLAFLIGGIWHGVGWTFVLWGALHGLYLAVNNLWRKLQPHRLPAPTGWLLMMLAVHFAWIFFRAPDVTSACDMIKSMCCGFANFRSQLVSAVNPLSLVALCMGVLVCCLPNSCQISLALLRYRNRKASWFACGFGALVAVIAVAALVLLSSADIAASQFIYCKF